MTQILCDASLHYGGMVAQEWTKNSFHLPAEQLLRKEHNTPEWYILMLGIYLKLNIHYCIFLYKAKQLFPFVELRYILDIFFPQRMSIKRF